MEKTTKEANGKGETTEGSAAEEEEDDEESAPGRAKAEVKA